MPLTIGPLTVDLSHRTARTRDGRLLPLTSAEFAVLAVLAEARGAVLSRDSLMRAALGRPWRPCDRGIDQLVFKLRRTLPPDDDGLPLVRTVRNNGYWMPAPLRAAQRPDRLRRAKRFYRLCRAAPSEGAGLGGSLS